MYEVQPFKHDPLDLHQPWVRVIDLLPQQLDGAIRCRLKHAKLTPSLGFTAVSYEWGSLDSEKHEIYINNMSYQVHHNLFLFLTSLQTIYSSDGYQNLWIDAVCIDQLNIEEKNRQVQQMKQIYRLAVNVLIWLGTAGGGSDELFDFLQNLYSTNSDESAAVSMAQLTKEQWRHYQEKILCAGIDIWKACEALSNRAYWSRIWIIQEILLAKQPLIVCGNKKILWQPWAIVLDTLKSPGSFIRDWAPSIYRSYAMSICRQWFAPIDEVPSDNLIQMVLRFSTGNCSKLHDKVYGLLGLVPGASPLRVDYGCDIENLYLDLLETLNPDTTISDIDRVLSTLEIETSCISLKLNNLSNSTSVVEDRSSQQHSTLEYRWYSQMARLQLNWRFTEPEKATMILLYENFPGAFWKCECLRCRSKLHIDTPSWGLSGAVSRDSSGLKLRKFEGFEAWVLYRELSGKYTYIATSVKVKAVARQGTVSFYDPFTLEVTQSEVSIQASLAQTYNLIAHRNWRKW